MATPTPRSPFAVQPKAPLRGQGPVQPSDQKPAEKPDFLAIAKERAAPVGGMPDKQRASTPMSGPALPAANPQGRGYTPAAPVRQAAPNYANQINNDPSIREVALAKLAEKQKAGGLAGMADKTRGMAPGRGDGGMVSEYPSAAIANPTETNPNPTAEDAAGMKAGVDALHDKSTPIFGSYWDDKSGMWEKETGDSALPPGVDENTPGVYYDPEHNVWTYDPEGSADMDAIDAQVGKALNSSAEDYGMSPELLAQNNADLDRQGAESKSKLSQQLAGRGLGASGLAGSGFGNIDVGTQSAKTALATDNFKIGVEARQNELKTLLTAHGNELSEKNRKEIADQIAEADKQKTEYERLGQKEADQFTFLHDSLANLGASSWSPEAWAYAMKMIKGGTSYEDAMGLFMVDGDKKVVLNPKAAKAAKGGKAASDTTGDSPNATYNEDGTADTSKPPPTSGISKGDWSVMSGGDRDAYWWFENNGVDIHGAEAPSTYKGKNWAGESPDQQANYWKTYYYRTKGA